MKSVLTDQFKRLDVIDPGTCVLFQVARAVHLGIVIMDSSGAKYICDLEADEGSGRCYQHYNGNLFVNDDLLVIEDAVISPDLSPASVGHGYSQGGGRSLALYLTAVGPVIYSGDRSQPFKINLSDGSIYAGDLASMMHAKLWRIEVSASHDRHMVLRSFGAEAE